MVVYGYVYVVCVLCVGGSVWVCVGGSVWVCVGGSVWVCVLCVGGSV